MKLTPIEFDINSLPHSLHAYISGANLYDSSCSPDAKTIFIDKDNGYFLKIAKKNTLQDDAIMTQYFHKKGLSANVCIYENLEKDYLITEKIKGFDATTLIYLNNPKKLCDTLAQSLLKLHAVDFSDCPIQDRTQRMLLEVEQNKISSICDENLLKYINIFSKEKAYQILKLENHCLQNDALIHGDYCLPNILLTDFQLSGFIDVGTGGVGDKHYDLFWAIWTLQFNLKTNQYKNRFLDCYGRDNIDLQRLKLCGIISALTI